MKTYPAITLVARHGRRAAIAVGAIVLVASLASALSVGGVLPLIIAAGSGFMAWGAARLLAEIVEVVAETLLPR